MFGKKKKQKTVNGIHILGLDTTNVPVQVSLSESGLNISTPSNNYVIALEKISNISWYDEVQIEKHIKSSFTGGVIGAATFGVAGAVIGSRPKEKQKRKVTFYLLIDYSDKQIVISSEDGYAVGGIVDLFKKFKPHSYKNIEL
jgi:hypothetical protein